MVNVTLKNYITENLANGFPETQIQSALTQAGWSEEEIQEAFLEIEGLTQKSLTDGWAGEQSWIIRHGKPIIIILIILIALPLLSYAGFLAYEKYFKAAPKPQPEVSIQEKVKGEITTAGDSGSRDLQRIQDIQDIQTALDKYYTTNKFYPTTLGELVATGFLPQDPHDPKTHELYLYTALGNPPSYYSLSFILEQDIGILKRGLQIVSPQNPLAGDSVRNQAQVISGQTLALDQSDLLVTDLGKTPFYPGEYVLLEVTTKNPVNLESVKFLLTGLLDLTDLDPPFQFRFSAPPNPGSYEVKVFAFDRAGVSYTATTTLTVKAQ